MNVWLCSLVQLTMVGKKGKISHKPGIYYYFIYPSFMVGFIYWKEILSKCLYVTEVWGVAKLASHISPFNMGTNVHSSAVLPYLNLLLWETNF